MAALDPNQARVTALPHGVNTFLLTIFIHLSTLMFGTNLASGDTLPDWLNCADFNTSQLVL